MFKQTVPLKAAEHGDLKILETNDYSYAREILLAPIVVTEIADIAREYPIVFPSNGTCMPCALMGLETGQKAYIDAQGQWQANYIPAHIRRYPFILGRIGRDESEDERFAVVFDPEAPQLNNANGHPVFTDKGELSEHMQRRMKLLEHMQRNVPVTRRLVEAIDNAGLLVERVVRLTRDGQTTNQITGMRVIDETKLNGLSHDDFAVLRDQGTLPLVYAHLLSWANFRLGPLAGMYPALAQQASASTPEFLFEGNDTLDFSKIFHND